MLFAVFLFSPQAHGYTDGITDPKLPSWLKPVPPSTSVTTFVGNGTTSSAPGTGTSSPFADAMQMAIDGNGNFYVVDNAGHSVRKITPEGAFTTLAGSGSAGFADGTGTSAQFNFPRGIAVDSDDNVYVVDVANNRIRKITQAGVVTTLAGAGFPGSLDGTGTSAQFSFPSGLTIDSSDNLFLADRNNHKIRKITLSGVVTTFAGSGSIGTLDGTGTNADFEGPEGIVVDALGNVYISQTGHSMIRKITPEGVVTSIAGSTAGEGTNDGTGTSARFRNPSGLDIDGAGNLFIADRENHLIRKISPQGVVITVAGTGAAGFADDIASSAIFSFPSDVLITGNGDLYVADQGNSRIRKIVNLAVAPNPNIAPEFSSIPVTSANEGDDYSYKVLTTDADGDALTLTAPTLPGWMNFDNTGGEVSTFAGNGSSSTSDGTGTNSAFTGPYDIAVDNMGNQYVTEHGGHSIRKITPEGIVTTLAGSGGTGFEDGTGTSAQFKFPRGIAVDNSGNLYVADAGNFSIRKITPEGVVSTFAGNGNFGYTDGTGTSAVFSNYLAGLAVDISGNVYVADRNNHVIRKITAEGVVSTLAGSGTIGTLDGTGTGANFEGPEGIAVDEFGNVYITQTGHSMVRKITPAGVVTSIAGTTVGEGNQDGTGTSARFRNPSDLAIDTDGNLIIADRENDRIRKVTLDGVVTTIAGSTPGFLDGPGTSARFGNPSGIAVGPDGGIYVADTDINRIRYISPDCYVITGNSTGETGDHPVVLQVADGNGGTNQQSFTVTVISSPEISVNAATDVMPNEATVSSSIISGGGPELSELGFVYALTSDDANPTLAEVDGSTVIKILVRGSETSFSEVLSSLMANSGYSFIAFATNTAGTTESTVQTFTTSNNAPEFTSAPDEEVNAGDDFSYKILTTDADGDALTVTAPTLPGWMNFDNTGGEVSTFAGNGSSSTSDGTGTNSSFTGPYDIAVDNMGNQYVTEHSGHGIRKITPEGIVTTLAGSGGTGFEDGTGTSAQFKFPRGIAVDNSGNLYVADAGNFSIRKITPEGVVSTFAGNGNFGYTDGTGTSAVFSNYLAGLAVDISGNVYVADRNNHVIRKITAEGVVSTLAGSGTIGTLDGTGTGANFEGPEGIAVDESGNVYITQTGHSMVRKITPAGVVTSIAGTTAGEGNQDGTGTSARFRNPSDLAIDADGNLIIADRENDRIRKVTLDGVVTTIAGSTPGFLDGPGTSARFGNPSGVAVGPDGGIYVADTDINRIRFISPECYVITGNSTGETGDHPVVLQVADGNGGSVQQSFTVSILTAPVVTVGAASNLAPNTATLNGNVTSDGGSEITERGFVAALTGIDASPSLAEVDNVSVFKVAIEGTTESLIQALSELPANTTFSYAAFATNAVGTTESTVQIFTTLNTAPEFTSSPNTEVNAGDDFSYKVLTTDADGDALTVTAPTLPDWMSLDVVPGQVSTFTNVVNSPNYIERDAMGNIYVADVGDFSIKKISSEGLITTIAGNGSSGHLDGTGTSAQFTSPNGITMDDSGNLYVTDAQRVRKITPSGVVSTLAGSGAFSFSDGTGTEASFRLPTDLDVGPDGNIYVVDRINRRIRRITPAGLVSTFVGGGTVGLADATGTNADFNAPIGIVIDELGNLYIAQQGAIRKVTAAGVVTTIAGSGSTAAADGTGSSAGFHTPTGITLGNDGNLYVADNQANQIRRVTMDGVVTRIAGAGQNSFREGEALNALFNQPVDLAVAENGDIYISDHLNGSIRLLTTECLVLSGNSTGEVGDHAVVLQAADGNGGSVQQTFSVSVTDTTIPILTSSNPADDASEFNGASITLTFSEAVVAGRGRFSVRDAVDDSELFGTGVGSSRVMFNGSTVTIDMSRPLPNDKDVYVQIPAVMFVDGGGNNFAGISDKTTLNFSTISTPKLISSNPADDSENFTGTSISLTFDRNISAGVGRISIVDADDDSEIDGAGIGSTRITIAGAVVTFNLGRALPLGKSVYVRIPATALKDAANIPYQGILDATTLNFSTPSIPELSATNPTDDGTDFNGTTLGFTFDRDMFKGSGRIQVMDAADDTEITGAGVGSSRVTISGSVVTFDLLRTLPNDKDVYVIIPGSAFKDNLNNFYPGIQDKSTLNFSTLPSLSLVSSNPADEAQDFNGTSVSFTFNRNIVKGTGRISVRDEADDSELSGAGMGSTRVTVTDNVLTFDLGRALPTDKQVYVVIPGSAVRDVLGNSFQGILDKTTLNFSSITAPKLLLTNPEDGSTGFTGTSITFTFDRPMIKGRGRIEVLDAADDSRITSAGVGSARVTIDGAQVTFDLIRSLAPDTEVYVKMPSVAFKDANDLFFAGLLDKTTLNFDTNAIFPEEEEVNPINLLENAVSASLGISLYPNPAVSEITIDLSDMGEEPSVRIVSINGVVKLRRESIKTPSLKVDVRGYAEGIYIVAAQDKSGQVVYKKFMVGK